MQRLLSRTIPVRPSHTQFRTLTISPIPCRELKTPKDIEDFLSTPSWSVRSLLPSTTESASQKDEVTPTQLRHLLRLSALPPPSSLEEEKEMLADLHAQLHFVRQIQRVDTTGVEPSRALRAEGGVDSNGTRNGEIGLEEMQEALEREEVRGKFHKRIRRRKIDVTEATKKAEDWDVLAQAGKRLGRYFVVESEREGEEERESEKDSG